MATDTSTPVSSSSTIWGMNKKAVLGWGIVAGATALLAFVSPKKTANAVVGGIGGAAKGTLTGAAVGFAGGGLLGAIGYGLAATALSITGAPLIAGVLLAGLVFGGIGAFNTALFGTAIGTVAGIFKGVSKTSISELEDSKARLQNAQLEHQQQMVIHNQVSQSLGGGYTPEVAGYQPANPELFTDNPAARGGHVASEMERRAQVRAAMNNIRTV